ncbi:energy transducer TonB [Flammeovirga sp. OC4]|uniref:energy transducer TonB n=1 Tax=Flammeovirga sp. OC4 TaxID=1382345 RepID=UPI0005C5128E|nr:energy transducer TonB [Flammeovirga sp. OC4]
MKKLFLTLFLAFYAVISFAQSKIFLTEYYDETEDETRMEYYILSKAGKSNGTIFKHTIYFLDGSIHRTYDTIKPKYYNAKEGQFVSYFKNGNKSDEGEYADNKKVGMWKTYHENGNLNLEYKVQYDKKSGIPSMLFVNGWDEDGNQTLKDGEGQINHTIYLKNAREKYTEGGKVQNSFKQGLWNGVFASGEKYFEENYKKGKLIKGVSWDEKANEYDYKVSESPATYPKGMGSFYNLLGINMRYPSDAKKNNVQGKVYVQFVVLKSGKLSDFKILKGVSPSIDKETIRVLKKSPKWKPGRLKGQTVKQRMVLPVSFRL